MTSSRSRRQELAGARWTWQFKLVRVIITIVKTTALLIGASYLDVMSSFQRGVFVFGLVAWFGDFIEGDLRACQEIVLLEGQIVFRSWSRTRVVDIDSLTSIDHPWYDVSRVWVRWRFDEGDGVTTTTNLTDLTAFVVQVVERNADVHVAI